MNCIACTTTPTRRHVSTSQPAWTCDGVTPAELLRGDLSQLTTTDPRPLRAADAALSELDVAISQALESCETVEDVERLTRNILRGAKTSTRKEVTHLPA